MTTSLVTELRAAATDPGDLLCIDLLSAEGYWWTRSDFIARCVTHNNDEPVFNPAEAINFAHLDRIATEAQLGFLRLALSLALLYEVSLWETIPQLDSHQLTLALNGIARSAKASSTVALDGSLATRLPPQANEAEQ